MNKQKDLWENLAKKNALYYINSDYGKKISEQQFHDSALTDFKRLVVDDSLIATKTGTILDIGCGIGRLSGLMSAFYSRVIGIDISGEMIRQARERLHHLSNVLFIESDGMTIPISDKSVDIVFSYLVFQHMKSDDMVQSNWREIRRILTSGGIAKVLVRTDVVDVNTWWGGVKSDETYPISLGLTLLKKEEIADYGLWIWLKNT